jgi:hypothetical protein
MPITLANALGDMGLARPIKLGNIASRCLIPGMFLNSQTQLFSRTVHNMRTAATAFRAVFANFHADTNLGETAIGVTTLSASIEYPIGATPQQILFNGATSIAMPSGGLVTSDLIGVNIPKGAQFAIKTHINNATGIIFAGARNTATGEGYTAGVGNTNVMTTTNPGVDTLAYGPSAIIAETDIPSILLVGDSRMVGENDGAAATNDAGLKGEVERSLRQFAFINAAVTQEQVAKCIEAGKFTQRLALAEYCTHVVSNYGVNDMSTVRTTAQIKADLETFWALFDLPVFQLTVAPYSSSSDSWATG